MCEAILAGAHAQLRADGRMKLGEVGIHCAMDDGDDEVARVMNFAGGARHGLVSDLLSLQSQPDNARAERTALSNRMGTSSPSTAECRNLGVNQAKIIRTLVVMWKGFPLNLRPALPLSNRARLVARTMNGVISQGRLALSYQLCAVPEVIPPKR